MNFLDKTAAAITKTSPASPAIITNDYILSYRDLELKTLAAAEYLLNHNIAKNEPVAILSENNPDFVILVLALWLLDAVPVPVNTRLTRDEIQKLLEKAGCNKIFIHNNFKNVPDFTSIDKTHFPFQTNSITKSVFHSGHDLENTAVIIFTSGSSGTPKGVMLSFRNLIKNAETGNQVLHQNSDDRWLASLPFYHIGGFSIITRALLHRASIIIPPTPETGDLEFSFKHHAPTLASLVSTQLIRLLESGLKPGDELKKLLLGGGFIDNRLLNSAVKKGWRVSKVYGSSETSSFVTMLTENDLTDKINSAGKALTPNKIFITDENGKNLPANKSGEIVVSSDAVMKGYINDEEATRAKLKDGFYFTGDYGYLDEDGYLYVEARRDDLIISGGENINPMEIQRAIMDIPGIKECFVLGLEDKTWGHIVAAAVIKCDRNKEIDIKGYLRENLAGYKIPKKIICVNYFPLTALGKIEKEKVKELFN